MAGDEILREMAQSYQHRSQPDIGVDTLAKLTAVSGTSQDRYGHPYEALVCQADLEARWLGDDCPVHAISANEIARAHAGMFFVRYGGHQHVTTQSHVRIGESLMAPSDAAKLPFMSYAPRP